MPIAAAQVNNVSNSSVAQSSTNRDFPTVTVAQALTDYPINWLFSRAVAAPGGLLYWAYNNNSAVPTFTIDYSTDSTTGMDGTWTNIPFTPLKNSSTASYSGGGSVVVLPAGTIAVRLKTTTGAGVGNTLITSGVFQLNSNPAKNDFGLVIGMSITVASSNFQDVARMVDPNRDPIVINLARASAKLTTSVNNMLDHQITPAADSMLPFGWIAFEPGPNDASDTAVNIASYLNSCYTKLAELTARGARLFTAGVSFTFSSSQGAYTDPATTGAGIQSTSYFPTEKTRNRSGAVDPHIDGTLVDMGSSIGLYYPGLLTADAIHPQALIGTRFYTEPWVSAMALLSNPNSTPQRGFLRRIIEDVYARGSGVPAYFKQRLQGMYNIMPSTSDATALANRAAMQSKIDAIGTAWVNTAGSIPGVGSGAVACWDFDDFSKVTTTRSISVTTVNGSSTLTCNQAGDLVVGAGISGSGIPGGAFISAINVGAKTISIAPSTCSASATVTAEITGCGDFVSQIADSINGYVLAQATAVNRPPYMPGVINGRGAMGVGQTQPLRNTLVCSDTAMASAWNAAGQDLTFAWVFAHRGTDSNIGSPWGFGANEIRSTVTGSNQLSQRAFHGTSETLGNFVRGAANYLVITKSGTSVNIRRNGVASGSGSWTKPLTTATKFVLGASQDNGTELSAPGLYALWYGSTSAATGLALADLEAWLSKKAGLS